MVGDKKEVDVDSKSSKAGLWAVFFGVFSIGSTYVLADTVMSNYVLAKPQFICTKIEQVGKNLDDVRCVQYTNQKYSQQAVAVNEMVQKSR